MVLADGGQHHPGQRVAPVIDARELSPPVRPEAPDAISRRRLPAGQAVLEPLQRRGYLPGRLPPLDCVCPLASGAPWGAAFPRHSFVAPQSRQRRAPPARSVFARSLPGRLGAPPSLVTPSSLLSPGSAAPLRLARCLPARFRGALGRRLPSSLLRRSSVQAAPRPSSSLGCDPAAISGWLRA